MKFIILIFRTIKIFITFEEKLKLVHTFMRPSLRKDFMARQKKITELLKLRPDYTPFGYSIYDLGESINCARAGVPLQGEAGYIPMEFILRMKKTGVDGAKAGKSLKELLLKLNNNDVV